MVEELRQVFERVQRQPEAFQRQIAELIQEELEDQEAEWEPTLAERAAIEASRAEYAAGQYRSFEAYDRERVERERP